MTSRCVWMDAWQFECCGDPYGVGSQVSWTARTPDLEWLSLVLGESDAAAVTDAEEHHAPDDEPLRRVAGRVTAIEAISVRFASAANRPRDPMSPQPGTAVRRALPHVEAFEGAPEGTQLVGYLVWLEAPDP